MFIGFAFDLLAGEKRERADKMWRQLRTSNHTGDSKRRCVRRPDVGSKFSLTPSLQEIMSDETTYTE